MLNDAAIEIALQQQPAPSTVDLFWWSWPTDEFAAWGQWAGGIGAIAAVITTLWIMSRDRRKHQAELEQAARDAARAHERELEAAEELRAARARAVVAGYDIEQQPTRLGKIRPDWLSPMLKIANHGSTPVLEVVLESVELVDLDGQPYPRWAETIAAARERDPQANQPIQFADVIGPGESQARETDSLYVFWRELGSGEARLRATFTFLDIDGYRWRRSGTGAPERLQEADVAWEAARPAPTRGPDEKPAER